MKRTTCQTTFKPDSRSFHSRRPFRLATCILVLCIIVNFQPANGAGSEALSLAGEWRFALDRDDAGVKELWPARALPGRIHLPGALQNQGFGDDISINTPWTGAANVEAWLNDKQYEPYRRAGNIKVPFCLQPEKHYIGAAWYQREVTIPSSWRNQRVVLTLERAHWETRVWLDHQEIGTNSSLSTPHVFDLGTALAPGKHTLTIRVDNRMVVEVGAWAHSVTDHTQGNWNGLVGRIELRATSPVWIEEAQVYPDVAKRSALVKLVIGNRTGKPGRGTLTLGNQSLPVEWDATGGSAQVEIGLGDRAQTWDEFSPALQKLSLHLKGDHADDQQTVTFGLRQLAVQDRQFVLNSRPTFFRGTLECCIFPLTGYPPTDVEAWMRIIRICQAHGLNHIRFHSFCPPEAAFVAADELGFYFSVEVAAWTAVGNGRPIDQWLYDEATRILKRYGNHPSFMMMPYGNEPSGRDHARWLGQWVNHWKQADPRRLYTSASGWPAIPENQYHVTPAPRGPKGWLGKDYRADVEAGRGRRDTVQQIDVPVIAHEMGQWCVYPNFDEIKKYTGPLKAKNFEIFRDSLAEHGMLDQWRDFFRASGKLQALCYKEEIEAALRTPGVSGFQLLDLHDFPGQGTALVGVLDPFWDSKGYITAKEYRRFCNATVPLARLLKRVWTANETLSAELEVAHFGAAPLLNAVAVWKLVANDGRVLASGQLPAKDIPIGQGTALGRITTDLSSISTPSAAKLVVGLKGTPYENDWKIWIYPAHAETSDPADVLISSSLDAATLARLETGGKVLFLPRLSNPHPRLGFEPVFWNRYMFHTQGRQTLGLLCNPAHPALALFPTESYADWQWADLESSARGMVLDELPRDLRPIVQPIDDWNTNRKLGLVWECRLGQGKLLVCSADLQKDLDQRPAARQMRASLFHYMQSKAFAPKNDVSRAALLHLLDSHSPSKLAQLGARVLEVDSEDTAGGNVAANAIDGDPGTIWHTRWQPANDPLPHHLTIDLGRELSLKGITYLPRQDQSNGRIAECDLYCSTAPENWGEPVARARWRNTSQLQTVTFAQLIRARYLKLVARSEVSGNPFTSIAELDVLTQ